MKRHKDTDGTLDTQTSNIYDLLTLSILTFPVHLIFRTSDK